MTEKETITHLRKIGISYTARSLIWAQKNKKFTIPFEHINNIKLETYQLAKVERFFKQYLSYFFTSWHDEFNHDVSTKKYVLTLKFKSGKKYNKTLKQIDLILASAAVRSLNEKIKTNVVSE